jgi:hypothetical protein
MNWKQTAIRSLYSLAALLMFLLFAIPAFAQDNQMRRIAAASGFFMFFLVFGAAVYIYFALALYTIAQKTNTENPWLAWIPIANIILILNIAKKPIWWIILFFIPLVVVVAVLVWMGVAEARNKPGWWGILMIVPLVNLIVPGYLAWAD